MLVWSYAFSYGVFLPYYTTTVFPSQSASQKGLLTVTGTVATGLMYVAAMVILNVCTRWPQTRRKLLVGGLVTSVMALVGSAFATEPWHLLVTWGFLFAIGGSELNHSMRYPVRLTKFQVHCTIQQTRICEWHLSPR